MVHTVPCVGFVITEKDKPGRLRAGKLRYPERERVLGPGRVLAHFLIFGSLLTALFSVVPFVCPKSRTGHSAACAHMSSYQLIRICSLTHIHTKQHPTPEIQSTSALSWNAIRKASSNKA